jgi:hypothetical protein
MLTVYVVDPKKPQQAPRKLDSAPVLPGGTVDEVLQGAKDLLRGQGYVVRSVNVTAGRGVVAYVYEPGNAPPGSPRAGLTVWSPPTRPRSS